MICAGVCVHKNTVALAKGTPPCILTTKSYGQTLPEQRSKSQQFAGSPVNAAPLDDGFLQWPAIITQLKRIGYDGYLTLEELVLHDRFDSVGEMIAWDAQYLQSLQ